ncbi:MAG: hypothetical protein O7E54_04960, partial [Planctomycetota bacterium]|nr:hypothetical protein [Planctomycetota bacterium]
FTHHMPTKVLSLLLSTILFLFVLDRQQDQSEIPNLRVVFRLSDEVGERWVIVGPRTVDLGGKITITGLRAKVAQAAFTLRGLPEQTKIIDAGLLTSFIRDPKQQEVTIRVDKELIKKLSVLPAGVEIKQLGPGIDSIILARRAVFTVRLYIPNTDKEARRLAPGSPWTAEDGTNLVTVTFEPKEVKVAGPAADLERFTKEAALPVHIEDVNETLKNRLRPGKVRQIGIFAVDWMALGIGIEDVEILEPAGATAADLHRAIDYCFIVKAGTVKRAIDLKARFQFAPGQSLEKLKKNYNISNQGILWKTPKIEELRVQGPGSLFQNEAFMNRLVAVINVVEAKEEAGRLTAFIYLDLKGHPLTAVDRENLGAITIQEHEKMPALVFNKK